MYDIEILKLVMYYQMLAPQISPMHPVDKTNLNVSLTMVRTITTLTEFDLVSEKD